MALLDTVEARETSFSTCSAVLANSRRPNEPQPDTAPSNLSSVCDCDCVLPQLERVLPQTVAAAVGSATLLTVTKIKIKTTTTTATRNKQKQQQQQQLKRATKRVAKSGDYKPQRQFDFHLIFLLCRLVVASDRSADRLYIYREYREYRIHICLFVLVPHCVCACVCVPVCACECSFLCNRSPWQAAGDK